MKSQSNFVEMHHLKMVCKIRSMCNVYWFALNFFAYEKNKTYSLILKKIFERNGTVS